MFCSHLGSGADERLSGNDTAGVQKRRHFVTVLFCSPEPVLANGGHFLYTTWERLHNEICVFLTWPLLIELQSAHQRRCVWPLQDRRLRTFPRLAIFVCVCPEPVLANTRYNSSAVISTWLQLCTSILVQSPEESGPFLYQCALPFQSMTPPPTTRTCSHGAPSAATIMTSDCGRSLRRSLTRVEWQPADDARACPPSR